MAEFEEVGASLNIRIVGLDKAEKQVDQLGDKLDALQNKPVEVRIKASDAAVRELTSSVDKAISSIEQRVKSISEVKPDLSGLRAAFSKELDSQIIDAWASKFSTSMTTAAAAAQATGQKISSSWANAKKAIADTYAAASVAKKPSDQIALRKQAEEIASSYVSMTAKVEANLSAIEARTSSFAQSVSTKIGAAMSGKTGGIKDALRAINSYDKTNAQSFGLPAPMAASAPDLSALRAASAAVEAEVTKMQNMASQANAFNQNTVQAVANGAAAAEAPMVRFTKLSSEMATGLIQSTHRIATEGFGAVRSAISEAAAALTAFGGDSNALKALFSPAFIANIDNIQSKLAAVNAAKERLDKMAVATDKHGPEGKEVADLGTNPEFIAEVKNLMQAEVELAKARQLSADSMLKSLTSSENVQSRMLGTIKQNLDAENRMVEATIVRKREIFDSLGAMRDGGSILENAFRMEQAIISLARDGQNLEEGTIRSNLRKLDIAKKSVDYAQKLVDLQSKVAKAGDGRFGEAEKTLLTDARAHYQYAVRNSTNDADLSKAAAGVSTTNNLLNKVNAREEFTSALEAVVNSLDAGVTPAYGRAIAAATRFGSALGAGAKAAKEADNLVRMSVASVVSSLSTKKKPTTIAEANERDAQLQFLETMGGSSSSAASKVKSIDIARLREENAATRENLQLRESILASTSRLISLYKYSSDIVGNEAKLLDVAREARRAGIPVEEKLLELQRNKSGLANNLYRDITATNDALSTVTMTNQTQLGQYKQMADTWRMIATLIKQSGKESITLNTPDGKKLHMTAAGAEQRAVGAERSALQLEQDMAADARSTQRAQDIKSLLDQRNSAMKQIVTLSNQAAAASKSEQFTLTELNKLIDATTAAKRDSLAVDQSNLNMTELRASAVKNGLVQERNLLSIMQDENALMSQRITAAQLLESLYKKMGTAVTANESVTVQPRTFMQPVTVDKKYIDNGAAEAKNFLAAQLPKEDKQAKSGPEYKTIKEAIIASEQLASSTDAAQKLETKYAQEVERARTALLAGVQPMENFLALRKAISAAAAAGVEVDERDLAILEKTRDVQQAIATQVANALTAGEKTSDKVMSAYVAKSAQPQISFLKDSGFDTTALEQQLQRVKQAAGAELEGSFAAAQKKVADTTAEVSKLLEALKYSTGAADSQGVAFNQNVMYVNRIIDALGKMRKAELDVLNSAEALNSMTEKDISNQVERISAIEQVKAAFEHMKGAQNSLTTNLGTIGNFNITDAATKQGAGSISDAAKAGKTNNEFVAAADSATNFKASIAATLAAIEKLPEASRASFANVVSGLKEMSSTANNAATQMNKLSEAHKRLAQNDSGASIFDRYRLIWFAQLRAFWEMYTNIGTLITTLTQYNQTLATTRAVTQSGVRDIQSLSTEYASMSRNIPMALAGIAEAALEVAKAGFNVRDTLTIIKSASKLAVATQDDIKTVADLQAVIIHAWHADVNDVEAISDQLFNAVAKSRADIKGLADAIGYVAGIAPQANVPLDQALGVISILTNAGLTMSKAGTYTRQFLNDLMNPSKKLQQVVANLGLSLQDIDPRLNSLESIFKTLAASGMNVADAFEGMNVRSASAFNVMLKNSNLLQSYIDDINTAGSVNEAFAISAGTVKSAFQLMVNALVELGIRFSDTFGGTTVGFLNAITALITGITDFGAALNSSTPGLSNFASGMLTFVPILLGARLAILGLIKAFRFAFPIGSFAAIRTLITGIKVEAGVATVATRTLGGALTALFTTPGGLVLVAAISAIGYAAYKATSETEELNRKMEQLKENLEDIKASSDKGFEMAVKVEEASTVTGKMTVGKETLENQGEMETPAQRALARKSMQLMSGSARASSDKILRGIGEEMSRAIPAPGASQEDMQAAMAKLIALYEQAIDRVKELKKDTASWAGDHNKLVESASTKMEEYSERVAKNANGINKNADAPESGSNPFGGLSGGLSRASTRKNSSENLEKIFDLYRDTTGRTSGMGVTGNSAGNALSDIFAGSQRVSGDMSSFGTQTIQVNKVLESMGMGLSAAEKEQLNLVHSAEEYKNVLQSILELRASSLDSPLRKGTFSPKELEEMRRELEQTATSMATLMSKPAVTEGQLSSTKRTASAAQRTLDAARSVGADKDYATIEAFNRLATALERMTSWEKSSRVSIATTQEMMRRDPSKVDIETRKAAEKDMADKIKADLEETTSVLGSSAARDKYSRMFGFSEEGQGQLKNQDNAALEKLATVVSEIQLQSQSNPLQALSPDTMKSFNKALEDFINSAMTMEGGGSPYERFALAVSEFQAKIRAAGGTVPPGQGAELARTAKFSQQFSQDMSAKTQLDPMDSLENYLRRVQQVRSEYAASLQNGWIDPKDAAANNKRLLESQRALDSYEAKLEKTRRTTLSSVSAFSIASASLDSMATVLNDISARSVSIDAVNTKLTEFAARLTAADEAGADAKDTMSRLAKQLKALSGMPSGSIESINAMEEAATSLSGNLGVITQQLKSVTGELQNAKKEMLSLKLASAQDALSFKKNYREASTAGTYFGGRAFKTGQLDINDQRDYIRNNAQYMDASTMRDNLKSLRDAMLSFAKENPRQAVSEGYLSEATGINTAIQDLYAKEYAVKAAEAEKLADFRSKLEANTGVMVDLLTQIRDALGQERNKLAGTVMGPLPALPQRPNYRMPLGTDIGSLSARYESNKDPNAVGWDKGGGTSYGKYQIAAKVGTMDDFLKFLQQFDAEVYNALTSAARIRTTEKEQNPNAPIKWDTGGKDAGSPTIQAWRETQANYPGRFDAAQEEFIMRSHYQPAIDTFTRAAGVMAEQVPNIVKQALFSTANQHGPEGQKKLVNTAVAQSRNEDGSIDYEKFLQSLYAARAKAFPPTSARYGRELADALAEMRKSDGKAGAPEKQPSGSLAVQYADYQTAAAKAEEAQKKLADATQQYGEGAPELAAFVQEVDNTKTALATLAAALGAAAGAMPVTGPPKETQKTPVVTAQVPLNAGVSTSGMMPNVSGATPAIGLVPTADASAAKINTSAGKMDAAGQKLKTATINLADSTASAANSLQAGAGAVSRGQRGFKDIVERYLIENWQNDTADAYAQELFTTQINNMKQGLTSVMTSSVRDAINGTNTAEDAAWNMIYAMIDSWIGGLVNNFTNAMMASMAGKTAVGGWAATAGNGFVAPGGFEHTGGLIMRHTGGEIPAFNTGGFVTTLRGMERFATGGQVTRGNQQKDSTIAALTKGEFVVQEPTVRKYGLEFMRALNEGNLGELRERLGVNADQTRVATSSSSFTSQSGASTVGQQKGSDTSGSGQKNDRPISIVNITDQREFERYLASPRGSRIVRNVVGAGSKRVNRSG